MDRFRVAQYIALGVTACSVIGAFMGGMSGSEAGKVVMTIGFIAGIISCIFIPIIPVRKAYKQSW